MTSARDQINKEYDRLCRCGVDHATKMLAAENVIDSLTCQIEETWKPEYDRMWDKFTEVAAENQENCRLLGLSGSKEAQLRAKIEQYKRALEAYGVKELTLSTDK